MNDQQDKSQVTTDAHTPGPWKWSRCVHDIALEEECRIYPPLGESGPVAIVSGEANAEFIVRACNSHYDLLAALKEMVSEVYVHNDGIRSPAQYETVALINARAAIAKAEGKTL